MEPLRLEPRRVTQGRRGCGHDKFYREIAEGLWTKPIHIDARSYWPGHETDELIAARIAGKSDKDIRTLVADLHAKRVNLARAS